MPSFFTVAIATLLLSASSQCSNVADYIRAGIENASSSSSTNLTLFNRTSSTRYTDTTFALQLSSTTRHGTVTTTMASSSHSALDPGSIVSRNHTANSTGVAANPTGMAYASACSNSWTSWSSASASWLSGHTLVSTVTTSYLNKGMGTYNELIYGQPENGSTPYATCAWGVPRYSGSWKPTSTSTSSYTTSTFPVAVTRTLGNFTEPTPTCSITPQDCSNLLDEWHDTHYLVYPFNATTGVTWPDGAPISYPHCNSTYEEFGIDCSGCWLIAENARLFYWSEPAVAEPNSLCPNRYVAAATGGATLAPSSPVTAVVTLTNEFFTNSTSYATLTSPTMYLSVEALEGRDGCHNFYGLNSGSYAPIIAGTIMPLGPDEQSSGIMTFPGITNDAQSTSVASIIANLESDKWSDLFGVGWQTSYQLALPITTALVPLNPADLGRPPPLLSYYFGPAGVACLMNYQAGPLPGGLPCNTIFDGEYVPQVQVGKAANAMNPMWSTCYRDFGWDPPSALSPASSVIGPSTPHPQSATTTSPAHNDHHSSSAQTSLGPSTTDPASPSSSPHVSTAAPTSRGGGDPTSSPNQPPNSASQHIQSTRISSSSTDPSSGGGSPDSSQTSSSNNPGGLIVSIIAGSSTQKVSSDPSPGSAGQGSGSGPASAASGGDPGASTSVSGSSAAFLLGSSSLTAVQSGSVFVVSGGSSAIATLTAGGAGTTIGTQVISAGSSALQVGSSTITFSTDGGSGSGSGSQTTINVAGQSIAIGLGPGKSGVAVIDGSVTLSNGESGTVVNGQSVSLGSQGLAMGSTTVLIGQDDPSDSVTTATIDGISYTMSAVISGSSTLEAVDGSITLTPGGAGTTLSNGKILSVPIAGGVVIGSSTIQVGPLTSSGQFDAIVNAGGQKFTAVQSGSYILLADGDSTITISDGQVTTFNGQIVSALSNGIGVAIDGSTTARFSAQPTADAIITAGGHTFTAYPSGDFILLVDGSSTATLRDGQTTILEGQTVKALLDGDGIVVGATKTDIFSNFSTSTSSRLAPSSGRLTSVSAAGTAASPFSTKSGAAMKKSAMREMLLAFSMAMAVVLI